MAWVARKSGVAYCQVKRESVNLGNQNEELRGGSRPVREWCTFRYA